MNKQLTKLLRDSYKLQRDTPEKSAYWHLNMLRSAIKKLESTELADVIDRACESCGSSDLRVYGEEYYCCGCHEMHDL